MATFDAVPYLVGAAGNAEIIAASGVYTDVGNKAKNDNDTTDKNINDFDFSIADI